MTAMQLELPFMMEDPHLRAIRIFEDRFERNRKSLHAKNGEVIKRVDTVEQKVDFLIDAICKGKVEFKFL
ncbi:MAG: hypothetical protein A3F13_02550 [Gammaproteobacteria bacterium RIFCSPHIGHO2_12_FULL_40_19]|nr:MAG: hypothetical protein A3F13_02550 [Gammaproteobacteria bacterium RIFCSPHIGHO2_12_FULL_40_19]